MTHKKIDRQVVDPDDSFTTLFTDILPKSIQSDIHASAIGKVTHYDKAKHECDVQILPLESDNSKVAELNAVLVPESIWRAEQIIERQNAMNKAQNAFNKDVASKLSSLGASTSYSDIWQSSDEKNIYKRFFKIGSVVAVGFFDRELDNYQNNNSNYKIETDRMHSLNDPFLIGVIKS